MQGGATRAMPGRIGEERRRRRRPRATFGCGGRSATGSREILKAPGSLAPVLTLSAAVREANACGRKLDTTPASIFQQPATIDVEPLAVEVTCTEEALPCRPRGWTRDIRAIGLVSPVADGDGRTAEELAAHRWWDRDSLGRRGRGHLRREPARYEALNRWSRLAEPQTSIGPAFDESPTHLARIIHGHPAETRASR